MTHLALDVEALSYGPEVAALPQGGGRVLAILHNAIYLESFEGYVVGILGEDAPDGPLAVRVRHFAPLRATLHSQTGTLFEASATSLTLGATERIRWDQAERWSVPLPRPTGVDAQRAAAVDALAELIPPTPRPSETAHLVGQRIETYLGRFQEAREAGDAEQAATALVALLGLGPGLTPSGDDMVAGLLAALVWQARGGRVAAQFVRPLVAAVREAAPRRTNRISARLLWWAGAGVLYAPAMDLGRAVLAGGVAEVAEPAHRLFAIGSSSGADMALGLLWGLR